MANKSHHAKLLSAIRDAVQHSSDEENVSFIVGSLLLFEQSYALSNKENFRKLLSEALAIYGPGSSFDGDDRVIPLYILLGKYSRSSTHAEIFDRMNETGTYRKSATFYVEWGKVFQQAGHSSRAIEIIHEGIKRNAKPESLLQAAIVDMGLETTTVSRDFSLLLLSRSCYRTPGRVLGNSTVPKSTRKQLFPKTPTRVPKSIETHFILPVEAIDPSKIAPVISDSLTPLLSLPSLDDSRSEDVENERPADITHEIYVKRKTMGILVPAAGFVLEDYDLAKVYEEDEKKTERTENNRMNIENNVMPSPGCRLVNNSPPPANSRDELTRSIFQQVNVPTEPTMPAIRALFQQTTSNFEPVVPTPTMSLQKEHFVPGSEALKFLRSESDEEDDKRLTGFAKLLEKRKSLGSRSSMAPPVAPLLSNQKRVTSPLEGLFSKMTMSSPSTSKD